jgi:hypothetical protein
LGECDSVLVCFATKATLRYASHLVLAAALCASGKRW